MNGLLWVVYSCTQDDLEPIISMEGAFNNRQQMEEFIKQLKYEYVKSQKPNSNIPEIGTSDFDDAYYELITLNPNYTYSYCVFYELVEINPINTFKGMVDYTNHE